MKQCRSCHAELQMSEFAKDKSQADGLNKMCRTCCNAIQERIRRKRGSAVRGEYRREKWEDEAKGLEQARMIYEIWPVIWPMRKGE